MNKNLTTACATAIFLVLSFNSCRKDGLNSATAKKIQYRWERISASSATDYLDGRAVTWTVRPAIPGNYLEYNSDGYFSAIYIGGIVTKFQYKVDGNKILSLLAGGVSQATTPLYTDTTLITYVDDHLLVLSQTKHYGSGAYRAKSLYIDSLKKK